MDAIMAPPGIPGAAMMVMPSIPMKWQNSPKSWGWLCIIRSASAQATILSVLPLMCIVAQSGITNPAMSSRTPICIACRSVTGIVAADD